MMSEEPQQKTRDIRAYRPSLKRVLACLLAVAAVAGFGYTFVSVTFLGQQTSSVVETIAVAVALLVWWSPVVWWVAWKVTVPLVLVAGVVAAIATHRYRLPLPSQLRWRRLGRVCRISLLIYGGWVVGVGAILLASLVPA
jgi:hypothetical protein